MTMGFHPNQSYPIGFVDILPGSRIFRGIIQDGRWSAGRDVTTPGYWSIAWPGALPIYVTGENMLGSENLRNYIVVNPSGKQQIVQVQNGLVIGDYPYTTVRIGRVGGKDHEIRYDI